ncbi:MAG: hypothetical protein F6J93_38115 [Oscillatoria sp. SIO1A7]|nr:hypothetical protein [Oscillatoria sp. SIO1A7]
MGTVVNLSANEDRISTNLVTKISTTIGKATARLIFKACRNQQECDRLSFLQNFQHRAEIPKGKFTRNIRETR